MILRSNNFYNMNLIKIQKICNGTYDNNSFNLSNPFNAFKSKEKEREPTLLFETNTMLPVDKNEDKFDNYINKVDIVDKLSKHLLKEIRIMALKRMSNLYPQENYQERILLTILLFLSRSEREDIKLEKYRLVYDLLDSTSTDVENNQKKYSSGKFSFLIVNLIHFFSFIMVYFLLSITFLQIFDQLSKSQIEKLLVNKEKVMHLDPDNIKDYFQNKMKIVNDRLDPDKLLECCLPYIFDPIRESN